MISIIIPALDPFGDQLKDIYKTVKSLHCFDLNGIKYEVLVVAPSEKIKKFPRGLLSSLQCIPESHNSHSGAINTGIFHSKGSHVLALNPGDKILKNFMAFECISKLHKNVSLSCNVISNINAVGFVHQKQVLYHLNQIQKKLSYQDFLGLPHQGLILSKNLHLCFNLFYNQKYNIRMDYELLSRVWMAHLIGHDLLCIPYPLTFYPAGGKSMARNNRPVFYYEGFKIDLFCRQWKSAALNFIKSIGWKFLIVFDRIIQQ